MIPLGGGVIGGLLCHCFGYRIPIFLGLIMSGASFFLMSRRALEVADPWLTVQLILCGFGFGLAIGLGFMNSLGMGHFHMAEDDISSQEIEQELPPLVPSIFQELLFCSGNRTGFLDEIASGIASRSIFSWNGRKMQL